MSSNLITNQVTPIPTDPSHSIHISSMFYLLQTLGISWDWCFYLHYLYHNSIISLKKKCDITVSKVMDEWPGVNDY